MKRSYSLTLFVWLIVVNQYAFDFLDNYSAKISQFTLQGSLPSYEYFTIDGDDENINYSEPIDRDSLQIKWNRVAIIGTSYTAAVVGLHIWQSNNWWSDERGKFHFKINVEHAQAMDKFSHTYATIMESYFFSKAFNWCGLNDEKSALWGSILALLYQTQIEIQDGFAKKWGFDVNDQIANTIGAGWFYARSKVDFLKHFDIKMSYYPSDYSRTEEGIEELGKKNQGFSFVNYIFLDYGGHTYWLSGRVWELLPERLQNYWPKFLALSVGVSAHNLKTDRKQQREYYLSLDYDFSKILPANKKGWKTITELLNFIHFPAPAVRISPDFKGFLLYYSQ
ncbi:MAG: DUF2279 domain-containing protein [Candidatus Cloacimonetes bacterium]|nr:DUF2279 domain-containing protein [Candidatus Cloacimonadota bacterium]